MTRREWGSQWGGSGGIASGQAFGDFPQNLGVEATWRHASRLSIHVGWRELKQLKGHVKSSLILALGKVVHVRYPCAGLLCPAKQLS